MTGNKKPISLWPMTPEEALHRAMSAPPMNTEHVNSVHHKASRKPAKTRKKARRKK